MSGHVSREELELYVAGAIVEGRAAEIERHMEACPACAGDLAREARVEEAMRAIGRRTASAKAAAPRASPARGRRWAIPGSAAVLVAAVLAAALWIRSSRPADPRLVCDAGDDAAAVRCRAAARCAGLAARAAGGGVVVPIYEDGPRECAAASPGLGPDVLGAISP